MSTYIFVNRNSNSMQISITAMSEDEAWIILQRKIDAAEELGWSMPTYASFDLTTAY